MCTGSAEDAISFSPNAADKPALRRLARQRRRSLAAGTRTSAEAALATHLVQAIRQHGWQNLAAYLATASELDLSPFLALIRETVPAIQLPAIDADGVMHFRRWRIGDALVDGPHGIAQPSAGAAATSPEDFDAVLLPLLGFDSSGTRLGSGAGYYDRALAFRRNAAAPPLLIGIAFEVQRFDALPREPWDIPLDVIVTEHGWQPLATTA